MPVRKNANLYLLGVSKKFLNISYNLIREDLCILKFGLVGLVAFNLEKVMRTRPYEKMLISIYMV